MADADRYKLELVRQHVPRGRLLEVGPSWGSFLYLAKSAGFVVEAVEMDPDCCAFIRNVIGARAINENDVCAALADVEPYDVIALWHVIEHLPNPWDALRAITRALRPGGVAVFAAPNPQGMQFRLLGRFWAHLDAPRHLELIPMALLERHMQELGCTVLLRTTNDEGTIAWNRFGWEVSLSNFVSRPLLRRCARTIGTAMTFVFRTIEQREGLGSCFTMAFRKAHS